MNASDVRPTTRTSQGLVMTAPRVAFRGMLAVLATLLLVWWTLPRIAERFEAADFPADYRTPASFSQDYWQYRRFARQAADAQQILVVGDSVVWGEYVDAGQTLSDHLTRAFGGQAVFRNGGLNGLHPLAMQGLCQTYLGRPLPRRVVLHFNPLWLTSAERDLQTTRPVSFNHPDLVPQFLPHIPAYGAGLADRLSVVVEREWPWRQWVRHFRLQRLDGQDLQRWSLEHPYEWPQAPSDTQLSFEKTRQKPLAWTQRGIRAQDFAWVDLDSSLQWRAFRDIVGWLRHQQVDTFVVVGPFNTHLLSPAARQAHDERIHVVTDWLRGQPGLRTLTAPTLASELYADASHPLGDGYRQLSERLVNDPSFEAFAGAIGPAASATSNQAASESGRADP
jgi:hypothetical protein